MSLLRWISGVVCVGMGRVFIDCLSNQYTYYFVYYLYILVVYENCTSIDWAYLYK